MIYICKQCGIEFTDTSPRNRMFCSVECRGLYNRSPREFVVCEQCGTEFEALVSEHRKFCSRECSGSYESPNEIISCKYCGKKFTVKAYLHQVYCSRKCARADSKSPTEQVICLNCGDNFTAKIDDNRKFCSLECVSKYNSGNRCVGWSLDERLRICKYCGTEFEVKRSTSDQIYCSYECRGKSTSGENHPRWNPEYNGVRYPPEFNEILREYIRERDGRKCQLCPITEFENGKRLAVHHIDRDKTNNSHTNLISLCEKCHGSVHGRDNLQQEYFKKLAELNEGEKYGD